MTNTSDASCYGRKLGHRYGVTFQRCMMNNNNPVVVFKVGWMGIGKFNPYSI
jgi:hypothetical protein